MIPQMMFRTRDAFRAWLQSHHAQDEGIWLIFGKAGKLETVGAAEALEEALCFGWIDGQIKRIDDASYMKRFTPRRKGSKWSAKNRKLVKDLIDAGQMTEHGLAAIERARKAGTWNAPGRVPVEDHQIQTLVDALAGVEPALSNFEKMSPSVRRTYTAWYLDARKEDTRKRRLDTIIERLNENKKPM